VIDIDQSPIGRTRARTGHLYRRVRPGARLFTQLPESRMRGYKAGRYSFNVKAPVEACEGDGLIKMRCTSC